MNAVPAAAAALPVTQSASCLHNVKSKWLHGWQALARRVGGLLLVLGALWPTLTPAHELSLAELRLREMAPGSFLWNWGTGGLGKTPADELAVQWPQGCTAEGDELRCQPSLSGRLQVSGIGGSYSAALLRITWLDGRSRTYSLTGNQSGVQLFGAYDDQRGAIDIVKAYTVLGVEHILSGLDHLMFVICLLFLVGFNRRLVWTITAFTAAHSLTLVFSALGWLVLRGPPVEAAIALSIVLMAAEALRGGDSLTRRLPAAVAFGFGLLHGLGFAGAIRDIGLPENHLLLALLTFNVGVEIGQLMTVAAAFLLMHLARQLHTAQRLVRPVLYSIGSVAAFWSCQRVVAVLA